MTTDTLGPILLTSGVVAALVSGGWNLVADWRRERREDRATRRQIRAAAHALAKRIILGRQFGFSNFSAIESSLAYLEDISKDRTVERALTDRMSILLHEAIDLCKTLIAFARNQGLDPESVLAESVGPDDRERRKSLFSSSTKPTFDTLRAYFEADGATDIVAEFDKAERERRQLEEIGAGRA
jgi:hypothetical protein